MDMTKVQKYVALYEQKAKLAGELDDCKDQLSVAETELMDEMLRDGLDSLKACGKSISVKRTFYASLPPGEGVDALLQSGMTECLMVGHQRFRALVKEHLEQEQAADPAGFSIDKAIEKFCDGKAPALKGLIKAGEEVGLSTRKAG